MTDLKRRIAAMGPGLLYAGAAVGVSHLVQSSRAGAEFGTQLLWVIVIANIIKYPFFQIGPRYTTATGKSLLEGYRDISPLALLLVVALTIATMFIIQAAITIVTAGLAVQLLGLSLSAKAVAAALLAICSVILLFGRFTLLDRLMKIVIVTLSITTILSLTFAFGRSGGDVVQVFDWSNSAHILFLVALVGWMPAPFDIAIWQSLWTLEKNKELGRPVKLSESLFDFNVGFVATAFLAICFALLGNFVMYGSGVELYPQAGRFAGQLIGMYTSSLGEWSFGLIALAAFTTMFSTTITCLDAFPRVLRGGYGLFFQMNEAKGKSVYAATTILTSLGALVILIFFISDMKAMVTLATVLSFVLAPIFAILNILVMRSSAVPKEARMSPVFEGYSWFGAVLILAFTAWFLKVQFL